MAIMRFTGTVLKNLFSRPATKMYPYVEKEFPKATRGQIGIDIDSCIFCGICSKRCPTSAIIVNKANKAWEIERFACIQCKACVDVCPKKCLEMKNQYTPPTNKKYSDAYSQSNTPKEMG